MKINYRALLGYTSTAYLDDHNEDEPTDGPYTGTDKHTDTPITVQWDDTAEEWIEIPTTHPEAAQKPPTATRSRTQTKRLTRAQRKKRKQ